MYEHHLPKWFHLTRGALRAGKDEDRKCTCIYNFIFIGLCHVSIATVYHKYYQKLKYSKP
jgi:hypothetical protein